MFVHVPVLDFGITLDKGMLWMFSRMKNNWNNNGVSDALVASNLYQVDHHVFVQQNNRIHLTVSCSTGDFIRSFIQCSEYKFLKFILDSNFTNCFQ